MSNIIYTLIGYVVGIILCFILFRPKKAFDEGYKAAKEIYSDWYEGFNDGWNSAFRSIKHIADVQPVVRGEWKSTRSWTPEIRCSICGYIEPVVAGENIEQPARNFCPNCGADMRSESDG